MFLRKLAARPLSILAAVLSLTCVSCTAGHVTKNGSPVMGAEISIWTCDDPGAFKAVTDSGGNFRFNPFDPSSPAFDSSEYVPTGPIAIAITGGAGSSVIRKNHQYTDVCPIAYNGSTQNQPCKVYNLKLVPMSLPELTGELADFLGEDCGLRSEVAGPLVAAALAPDLGEIGGLTTEPPQVSCITRCAESCSGQPMADFAPCMCICVEGSCGVSFGPFCTETTP